MLAIPGIGPVVAAGWLAALASGAVGGGVAGGIIGAIVETGTSKENAELYAEALRRGGAIVTATVTQSLPLPEGSPAASVSKRVLPSVPWLVWEGLDATVTRRVDTKMAALRSYVKRAADPVVGPVSFGAAAATRSASASLDTDDRQELARSLGVPSSVLDEMLSKLDE